MKPHLRHSHRCIALAGMLTNRGWCSGNGGCGYTQCICAALREKYQAEHRGCIARYDARIRELGHKLSGDGKSAAQGADR